MVTYTLHDLAGHIRQVLALNFAEPVWIRAEVSHCSVSRGHYYLDLLQKSAINDEPVAQASAMLWAQDYRRLQRTPDFPLEMLLQSGLELRMQVSVDYHERYGLKLQILDLDAAFTFGQLALERQKSLKQLKQLGLLDKNATCLLPPVIQRIAVLSSENAAGYQDFNKQLHHNPWGYRFECTLFQSAVQGRNAVPELLAALKHLWHNPQSFDAVAIIRGGGAKLDLAAFDNLELAKAVAHLPLPVFSGIGHETDQTLLDQVVHTALKTPTAVAEHLIQHNLRFENAINQCADRLHWLGGTQLRSNNLSLDLLEGQIHLAAHQSVQQTRLELDQYARQLPQIAGRSLEIRQKQLENTASLFAVLDPEQVLRRGYSLTLKNGKPIKSADSVKEGDLLETRLPDGVIHSKVLPNPGS